MKKIAILGSTGSIGTQALSVIREQGGFEVTALSCGSNIRKLEEQIREFHPGLVSVAKEEDAKELSNRIRDLSGVRVSSGMDALVEAAAGTEAELVLTAFVGMVGIRPTLEAIRSGKDIALANKETMVTAGQLICPLAKEKGVRILPVDSEHSAIFQCLQGNEENRPEKILLTASGGPFRGMKRADLEGMKAEDALKHPNWSMGKKITIDSATLVNKGLEIMEATWLFDVGQEKIQVVVQPKSIIHSMVEFEDGAVMAQLGTPDMRLPIAYALHYPKRPALSGERLDFTVLSQISFERPDEETFLGLPLARQALKEGGNRPTIYNAANEKAVGLFLEGKIGFLSIWDMIGHAMSGVPYSPASTLEEVLETEQNTYEYLDQRMNLWALS